MVWVTCNQCGAGVDEAAGFCANCVRKTRANGHIGWRTVTAVCALTAIGVGWFAYEADRGGAPRKSTTSTGGLPAWMQHPENGAAVAPRRARSASGVAAQINGELTAPQSFASLERARGFAAQLTATEACDSEARKSIAAIDEAQRYLDSRFDAKWKLSGPTVRSEMAELVDKQLLRSGIEGVASASGSTLRVRSAICGRVLVERIFNNEDMLTRLGSVGFKRISCSDGYSSTTTLDVGAGHPVIGRPEMTRIPHCSDKK